MPGVVGYTTSPYYNAAVSAANTYGVPVNLFIAQIGQESGFNPTAVNGQAVGIAQFMPATAQSFGINPNDPYQSLNAAAQYDAQLYSQSGSWQQVLQSYGTTAGGNGPQVAALASQLDQTNSAYNAATGANLPWWEQAIGAAGAPLGITAQGVDVAKNVVSTGSGILSFLATPSRWISVLLGAIFVIGGLYLLGSSSVSSALENLKGKIA